MNPGFESLTYTPDGPSFQSMDNFDELLSEYRNAVDTWVAAIKAEEALANDDHSMVEMEKWDTAEFTVNDAEAAATKARANYKSALRKKNYGF